MGGTDVMERTSRKIPVTDRQFLWVQDDDKGEVTLHVGPTMVSPTAADRVVVDDGAGGFKEDVTGRPQSMVELGDGQYAVLSNPLVEGEEGPNGRFRPGRNESRALRNGTRSMIPGPCSFYLRPGQRADVRDAHELASNQYLVVKVYGEVDKLAPFYEVTARSATITRATAEADEARPDSAESTGAPASLKRGQLIVIRGLDTQFYIPPSGVDVVPDDSVDALVAADVDEPEAEPAARRVIARGVDQSARGRARKAAAVEAAAVEGASFEPRANTGEARRERLIRRAVVLGEKEYCVIVDADGKREIKRGPARVFPGPYDTFMTKGSRERVYDAYELLPQRALWLRVISQIGKAALAKKLPRGVALDRDEYLPGDELLVTGVSSFFFPFNEIEVLSPETGLAVVGNDHARVFIEAIGIDQKSGIYVRDLETGEARLVRAKQSYLVDPRKEVQITRTVPAEDWNLWIASSDAHKRATAPVTTPWALSITVPMNTAVMVTSASDRRVVEGPCVALLGYEETLTRLQLSTGTPKSDEEPLATCFLRTTGNRVSDVITVETADFVRLSVHVSYSVTFLPEHKDKWFNHENYIQVMVDHLRSLVRGRCRTLALPVLWPQVPSLVRDLVLGERKDGARPGRLFAENGAMVTEVEVLGATIEDAAVASLMQRVQTESVTLAIHDRKAQDALASAKLRESLDLESQAIAEAKRLRDAKLAALDHSLSHDAAMKAARDDEAVLREQQTLADERERVALAARLARRADERAAELSHVEAEAKARAEAERTLSLATMDARTKEHELEVALIAAQSAATVAERQAVQRQLVEALTALGDKVLMSEVASNMNLVSLFKGRDVGTILGEVLGGTKVAPTLRAMVRAASAEEAEPAE